MAWGRLRSSATSEAEEAHVQHGSSPPRQPGDRTVRVGGVLFGVGVLGVLAVVVPFLLGREDAPLGAALVALLLPVGLGTALVGLLRGARARRRKG